MDLASRRSLLFNISVILIYSYYPRSCYDYMTYGVDKVDIECPRAKKSPVWK